MPPRKSFESLSPGVQHRLTLTAQKFGVSITDLRADPALAKAARGHAASESHPERITTVAASGRNPAQWRVGGAVKAGRPADVGYKGRRGPGPAAIRQALKKVKTRMVRVAIAVVSRGYFAEKPKKGPRIYPQDERIGTLGVVMRVRDLDAMLAGLPPNADMATVVNNLIPSAGGVDKVISWSLADEANKE